MLSIVAEAHAAGLLHDCCGRLVFRHDLLRHALADAVPASTRAMLHGRTASTLAAAGAAPERVAEHLLNAAPSGGEFLITWLMDCAAPLTARAPVMALRLIDLTMEFSHP
ncbi:hypothetical protein EST92_11895 [Streptomyces sp. TM32]|uniref:hypothetical protein n=1 Tax=Streptomyces sp. TM32 TaxID=1652669 RepID=UPI001013425E|nr:hypothetical protein [Streptomyces sp. TM32]RXS84115.1 hypothetical protein EST92_11895 [Streptomyces sp. TM32]